MGLFSGLFGRRGTSSRTVVNGPTVTTGHTPQKIFSPWEQAIQDAANIGLRGNTRPIPNSSGYLLITDQDDHERTFLGRVLDFQSNRGMMFGRGATEKVLLDGHIIYETQIRNTSTSRLKRKFADNFDIQQLSAAQCADILANEEDDPAMFGVTANLDEAMEDKMEDALDELRAELEEEYAEQFEEDYQSRLKQEYPGMFSTDFKKHYTNLVQDELDDVVDDHEELYTEYIVTDKHIRYKR